MTWFEHPNVTTVVHSRSTSVGDVLEMADGRLLQVIPFGFREIVGKALPAESSALAQTLHILATGGGLQEEAQRRLLPVVRQLYTALLFAAEVLETLPGDAQIGPDQVVLAGFAAEQARWTLSQADGD